MDEADRRDFIDAEILEELADLSKVDSDASCIDCRYQLRGLWRDSECPECGKPIEESLAIGVRHLIREEKESEETDATFPLRDIVFLWAAVIIIGLVVVALM